MAISGELPSPFSERPAGQLSGQPPPNQPHLVPGKMQPTLHGQWHRQTEKDQPEG